MGPPVAETYENENSEPSFGATDQEAPSVTNTSFITPPTSKPNTYEETTSDHIGLYALVGILQLVGITALTLAIVWSKVHLGGFAWDGGGRNFNWHTVCMTIFIIMYGNAAVVYRITRRMEKMQAKRIHTVVNALAFFFAVIGLVAVFRFHNVKNIPNVYSLHSWIGLGTVSLYACQLAFGFIAFLFPRLADANLRRKYLKVHVFFGGVMLALVVVAAVSGITEKMLFAFKPVYAKFVPVTYVANMLGVAIAVFVMGVAFVLFNSSWKRVEVELVTAKNL